MAEIEIVYLKGYCDCEMPFYDEGCHSEFASEVGKGCDCSCFDAGGDKGSDMVNMGDGCIGFTHGNCINAKYHYCHKGCTTKKYEIHTDCYDRETDSTQVTIGNKTYDCVKVKLNGKCIFNSYDDEEEHKNGN